jgi:hypothetical protein
LMTAGSCRQPRHNLATRLASFGEDKLDAMRLARLTQWGMLRPG